VLQTQTNHAPLSDLPRLPALCRAPDARPARQAAVALCCSAVFHLAALFAMTLPFGSRPTRSPALAGTTNLISVESTACLAAEASTIERAKDLAITVAPELQPRDQKIERRVAEVLPRRTSMPAELERRPPMPLPALLPRPPRKLRLEPVAAAAEKPRQSPPKRPAASPSVDSRAIVGILSSRETAVEPIDNPPPLYPPEAIANRWQGRVLLRLRVSAQGIVEMVTIVTSTGISILDEAAVLAVRQWRFRPAQRGDRFVTATVLVPVVFDLAPERQARS
jgi:periplasmic protein TonB